MTLLAVPLGACADQCWRELRFAASNGWLGATASVTYSLQSATLAGAELSNPPQGMRLQPHGDSVGRIGVQLAALRSTGTIHVWHDPRTQQVLQIRRIGHGRDSRMKLHRFLQDGVWRERHRPDPEHAGSWLPKSVIFVPYPEAISPNAAVLTPIMLLERASQLATSPTMRSASYLVFTDTQMYNVKLEMLPARTFDLEFDLHDGALSTHIKQSTSVHAVAVIPHLLGDQPEDDSFSVLELSGDIVVFIDPSSALPVRLHGSRFGIGNIPVTLAGATVEPGCGQQ